MTIKTVEVSATFNLGNYQSVKFGFTADIDSDDSDDMRDVVQDLKIRVNEEARQAGVKVALLLPL